MKADFEKIETKESLIQDVKELIYRLLDMASDATMNERKGLDGKIDRDDLLNELEDFAGREYIISVKLRHNFTLDEDDVRYLQGLINEKRAS